MPAPSPCWCPAAGHAQPLRGRPGPDVGRSAAGSEPRGAAGKARRTGKPAAGLATMGEGVDYRVMQVESLLAEISGGQAQSGGRQSQGAARNAVCRIAPLGTRRIRAHFAWSPDKAGRGQPAARLSTQADATACLNALTRSQTPSVPSSRPRTTQTPSTPTAETAAA